MLNTRYISGRVCLLTFDSLSFYLASEQADICGFEIMSQTTAEVLLSALSNS